MRFRLIITIIFFSQIKLFSQKIDVSENYLSKDYENNHILLKLECIKDDLFFMSIKTIDSLSPDASLIGGDYNMVGVISINKNNKVYTTKIIYLDDKRVDSISFADISENKIELELYKEQVVHETKRSFLAINKQSIENSKNFRALKKIHLSFIRNVEVTIPSMNLYYNNFSVYNFRPTTSNIKVVFYKYSSSISESEQIQFKPYEAIIIVKTLINNTINDGYSLAYLKAKSRITEGQFQEYYQHLWIKQDDLNKYFKYQK